MLLAITIDRDVIPGDERVTIHRCLDEMDPGSRDGKVYRVAVPQYPQGVNEVGVTRTEIKVVGGVYNDDLRVGDASRDDKGGS